MELSQKWSAKDIIVAVVFAMLLIVIQLAINMICMVNNFASMVLSLGISSFVCGPIYFLMVSKVNKRFVSFIYMTMVGIAFLIMGNWFLLVWFMLIGVVCEMILWKPGANKDTAKVTISWLTYSELYLGVNILPILFFWDDFVSTATSMGMSQEYLDTFLGYYQSPAWLAFIIAITAILSFLGCFLGKKLINKHFIKAGIL